MLALSHFCSSVRGCDIVAEHQDACELRSRLFARKNNITYSFFGPDVFLASILNEIKPGAVIFFNAVLEHLTNNERLQYLRMIWSAMTPGDYLVFVETPNRLAYFDSHTTSLEFAHLIPDEIYIEYIKYQQLRGCSIRFSIDLIKDAENDFSTYSIKRARYGLGVSFHDISAAIHEELDEVVVSDGLDDYITDFFYYGVEDEILLSYFKNRNISQPVGFSRAVLSAILQKPHSDKDRAENAERNRERREYYFKKVR